MAITGAACTVPRQGLLAENTGGQGAGGQGTASSSSSGGNPCSPGMLCPQVASECISLVDNSVEKQFTLRMSDMRLTSPPSLTQGLVKGVVQNGVTMNLPACNLDGNGAFSWLLQFDRSAGTLKTGGGNPALDPTKGYTFVNAMITQGGKVFKVAPFTADAPITAGAFAMTVGHNVTVPIYLDLDGSSLILLPLHDAKLAGTISADNNCIGQYNSKGLDPAKSCLASDDAPAFIGGDGLADSDGQLGGYITLEEADTVIVDAVGQSLCVILSGDATKYGDGMPLAKCTRDAGLKIVFQGDWCDTPNDASCHDSIRMSARFSASGVSAK